MKRCCICAKTKPLAEFYRHFRSRDGRQSQCKVCSNETLKAWKKANPERNAANVRRHRQRHALNLESLPPGASA